MVPFQTALFFGVHLLLTTGMVAVIYWMIMLNPSLQPVLAVFQ